MNNFILSSIKLDVFRYMKMLKYEINDSSLRKQIISILDEYLNEYVDFGLINQYFIVCDATLNTPDLIDLGKLCVYVDLYFVDGSIQSLEWIYPN